MEKSAIAGKYVAQIIREVKKKQQIAKDEEDVKKSLPKEISSDQGRTWADVPEPVPYAPVYPPNV
jgi:hypothetical protein